MMEKLTKDGKVSLSQVLFHVACSIFDLVFLVRNFPRLGLLKHCLSPFSFGTSLFKKACGISGGSKRRGKEIVQSFVCGFNREFPKAGASENETAFAFPVGFGEMKISSTIRSSYTVSAELFYVFSLTECTPGNNFSVHGSSRYCGIVVPDPASALLPTSPTPNSSYLFTKKE